MNGNPVSDTEFSELTLESAALNSVMEKVLRRMRRGTVSVKSKETGAPESSSEKDAGAML